MFALEYVSTALSTVGFGSHSYNSSMELVYVCLLEALSAVYTASLIAMTIKVSTLVDGFKFQVHADSVLNQRNEWVFFKLQSRSRTYNLSSTLSKNIMDAYERRFLKDHNVIKDEFLFYKQLSPKL